MRLRHRRSSRIVGLLSSASLSLLWGSAQGAIDSPPWQPPAAPSPSASRSPDIKVLEPAASRALPGASAEPQLSVIQFRIEGNTLLDNATLQALIADAQGRSLSLDQLHAIAERITAFYRQQGHVYTRAIVPAQVINNGIVTILVIEARYGRVQIDNRSAVPDQLLRDLSAELQPERPVLQRRMDRALLLMSDLPGVVVRGTLSPGEKVGRATLAIQTDAGPRWGANVTADNFGSPLTGRYRVGGDLVWNNPLGSGDQAQFGALSAGSGLNHARLAYERPLGGWGTRVNLGQTVLRYGLDGLLTHLGASGTISTTGLSLNQPVVRGVESNLQLRVLVESTQLRERIVAADLNNDRAVQAATLSLSGDLRSSTDALRMGTWQVAWAHGHLRLKDSLSQSSDATTAQTQGSFDKWSVVLTQQWRLGQAGSVYGAASGQWASKNLDTSQKLSFGGPNSIRAFDAGVASGDSGVQFTLEYRHRWLLKPDLPVQGVLFWDAGRVIQNRSPWSDTANRFTLQGGGVGVVWANGQGSQLRTMLATPMGKVPSQVGARSSTKFWVDVVQSF
ncbi:ShlB/FhaC/HecB family hemolysin secretion/activation protein [Roseateles sp. SL47]|uniref:ShlB/FhaC/HecB family hemolysin secretion/activation protein n=1 Tax=Roseateles sp. SL47 TaxID=2995138 RepID=UPI00226FA1EF|nr:ShlB/FhaC/HecB family hemolysin secretion/activation protein [Roseateles sp. SL47]WAC74487.1 ShlB/FhaC/HecB family hemolysin secretion/activation protein [Roseateles sp. SL47]